MINNQQNYQALIDKLDAFTRKYYKNQLIRGLIYSFTGCLLFFLTVTALEYFAHFSTTVRTVLFYGFIASTGYILTVYILVPLFHLYKLGKIISHEKAAEIIGDHFADIKDKLLNTLQLKKQSEQEPQHLALINASIDQRIAELKPVPFSAAIDLNSNRKYLRYAIIPVLSFVVIAFKAPSLLKDGTQRLIKHTTYFEKPAPFSFEILNKELQTVQQGDFDLHIKLKGTEIPENVYISINNAQFKLDKENNVLFNYTFKNVQQDVVFSFTADGINSKEYELKALPNPLILNFDITLNYPAYLGKPSEKLNNTGDLIVPAGTKAKWSFNTRNTRILKMNFQDTLLSPDEGNNTFTIVKNLTHSNQYSVVTANQFMRNNDSMLYNITVIPDLYPTLLVEQQMDSLAATQIYFKGLAKDDYGFSKLNFTYHFLKTSDSLERIQKTFTENINISRNSNQAQFFYYLDVAKLMIMPGDEFEYYFEVWDNDGVTGAKSARSQTLIYKAPSLKEIAENTEKKNQELKDDLSESIKKAKKLQKDVDEAAKRMIEKKNLDFDDKKKIEDLLKQQKELEKLVNDMQKNNEKNNSQQQEFKKFDNAIAEKHKQLEELFNKVMNDDMKKMMQELEKLLSEFDKQKAQEMLEKMKLNDKDLEKELDRTLELFKALEVEQKTNEAIKNLEDLSKEQKQLAEKTEQDKSENADNKELKDQQSELNKKFDDLQKELKDIEKKNSELEFPKDIENTDKQQEDIEKDMQNSEQQLGENKKESKSKASKSQKSAGEKLQQMAQQMKQKQEDEQSEQEEEDMAALRYLLENLIQFSFDQEQLMQELKTMDINNPKYLKLSQQQRKLKDDSKILEDSLFALSKRVPQISSVVNKEISAINDKIADAIDHLQDRMVPQARSEQQYIMTSTNNLALLLNDAMDQMSKPSDKPGSKSCKKPGKGKPNPSASQMKKMQEQLNEQIKEAKEAMKKGAKDGKKPGDKPGGEGGQGMSEQLARMAAQQEAIRNELQKYNQQENKDGGNKLGDLGKLAKEMEETEKDIVNKRITEETLKRQQDIMTRLLEAEKAERERDQEEKRQANENKSDIYRNPPQFEEYKRLKMQEVELLKTIPPSLTPFYKNLVNYYFQNIDN